MLDPVAPKITFTSNVALDRASLEAHASLRRHGEGGPGVRLVVPPDTAKPSASPGSTPPPNEEYDPSQRLALRARPGRRPGQGARYDVAIEPGLVARDGNLPSDTTFAGTFLTPGELRFVEVNRVSGGRFAGGNPRLRFSTPIDEKSLGALVLEPPAPRGATPFAPLSRFVGINASLLAPNTDYAVTIGADLRDTYGQRLGTAARATFRTGDLAPDVWAPSGTNLFPSSRNVRLNVVAVNAPPNVRAIFRALRPADVVLYPDLSGASDRGDMLPPASEPGRRSTHAPRNVERTVEIPLRAKLGAPAGVLGYGVAATYGKDSMFVSGGVVQITDLGAFAQWFPDSGAVRVHRIADGTPVAGASVEVYPSQAEAESKSTPVACAAATTDAAGVAAFPHAAFARCAAYDKGEDNAPSFVTIVRRGGDWTYVRTESYSGAYAGDFFNGWSSAKPLARGTIFSDRQLYQPGETAQMTAVGWFLVDGALRRGTAPSYTVTLGLPSGDTRDLGRRSLDAFGTFSIPVALPKNAALGYYSVRASAGNGEEIDGDFRVAEFKPPNFKVDLALDHTVAPRGATVARARPTRTSSAPGCRRRVDEVHGHARAGRLCPQGTARASRSVGTWFWPQQAPDASTDVLETTVTVDADGKSSVSVPVAADLPYPMTYQVDAETTDATNIAVGDASRSPRCRPDTLVGLKTDDVGTAGTPLAVSVIATDPAGAARSGTKVHVELQLANYATATQIVEGSEQATQSVTYATVASADATSGERR